MYIGIITDTHYGYSEYGDSQVEIMLREMATQNIDILIHCGDIQTTNSTEAIRFWKLVRSILTIPIYSVMGNHDEWVRSDVDISIYETEGISYMGKPHSPLEVVIQQMKIMEHYNINYISGRIIDIEINNKKYQIGGFNGWYYYNVHTNDRSYIPHYVLPEGRQYLITKSQEDFQYVTSRFNRDIATTILVSHFPVIEKAGLLDYKAYGITNYEEDSYFGANPNWENYIENVDYYFFGHTHIRYDELSFNGITRCINVGSNYENPKYRIMEV